MQWKSTASGHGVVLLTYTILLLVPAVQLCLSLLPYLSLILGPKNVLRKVNIPPLAIWNSCWIAAYRLALCVAGVYSMFLVSRSLTFYIIAKAYWTLSFGLLLKNGVRLSIDTPLTRTDHSCCSIRSVPLDWWEELWQIPLTIIYGNLSERHEYCFSPNIPLHKAEIWSNYTPVIRTRTPLFTHLERFYAWQLRKAQGEWILRQQWFCTYQWTCAY